MERGGGESPAIPMKELLPYLRPEVLMVSITRL